MVAVPDDDDERLHTPLPDLAWMESSSWAFADANGLGGALEVVVRPNLGVIELAVSVLDGSGYAPEDQPYHDRFAHLPIPRGANLDSLRLPAGLSLVCREPFARHHVVYERPGEVSIDLDVRAALAARAGRPPDGGGGRVSQSLRVSGRIELPDRCVVVDGFGVRHRSWGVRPDTGEGSERRKSAMAWGGGMGGSFRVAVALDEGGADLAAMAGHVERDGRVLAVRSVTRTVEERDEHGHPRALHLAVVDEGRHRTDLSGEVIAGIPLSLTPGLLTLRSVVRWETAGGPHWWGQDDERWPVALLRAQRRAGRSRDPWMRTAIRSDAGPDE